MKKNLLSIGEVARLKKVTVKALRYYEKIGILLPAYIDEESGYRYYTMQQMVTLDFILVCLDLGIPLKRFPAYLEAGGILNIDLILQDGTETAKKEIARINRTMEQLKNMSAHLEESEHLPGFGTSFTQHFPARFLLASLMNGIYPAQKQYISALTDLFFQMEEEQLVNHYKQGLLYQIRGGSVLCYTYNEIKQPDNPERSIVLPEGEYICRCFGRAEITTWLEWAKPFIRPDMEEATVLLQERYERRLAQEPFWEIQIYQEY